MVFSDEQIAKLKAAIGKESSNSHLGFDELSSHFDIACKKCGEPAYVVGKVSYGPGCETCAYDEFTSTIKCSGCGNAASFVVGSA